nr:hypothetical protein [Tanacetum cinerariifolium]
MVLTWWQWLDGGGDVDGWRWRLWSGDAGRGVATRGGEWCGGSSRSGDKKAFWFRPEGSPEKFSGVGGGGRRWWPAAGGEEGERLFNPNTSYLIKFKRTFKIPKEKKLNLKHTARISFHPCCFSNPQPVSPPYHPLSPPTDYQLAPPSTPNASPPLSPILSSRISPIKILLTLKITPPPLTSPPSAPTQPSRHSSPLAINLDPTELLFSTPPTSPQTLFDTLEDLPPTTTNLPPHRPSFDSIDHLANEPPPSSAMEPPLPPLPPQLLTFPLNPPSNFPPLPPLGPNNPSLC